MFNKRMIGRMLLAIGAVCVLGVLAALAVIYSGVVNVGADIPHSTLMQWALDTGKRRAIEVRANDIDIPKNFDSPDSITAGAVAYDDMCVACHLRPGMKPTPLHKGLTPQPPDLTRWSASPAYAFQAIKHGVRSTGMPAWGRTHEDRDIWNIVAFQRQLTSLTPAQYAVMVRDGRQRFETH